MGQNWAYWSYASSPLLGLAIWLTLAAIQASPVVHRWPANWGRLPELGGGASKVSGCWLRRRTKQIKEARRGRLRRSLTRAADLVAGSDDSRSLGRKRRKVERQRRKVERWLARWCGEERRLAMSGSRVNPTAAVLGDSGDDPTVGGGDGSRLRLLHFSTEIIEPTTTRPVMEIAWAADDEDLVYLRPSAKKMKSYVPVANGVSNVNSATTTYSTAKWLDVKCLRSQHDGSSCTYKDKRIHYSSLRAGKLHKTVGSIREEYHLKADNGDSQSQTVQLNGKALVVNSASEIPTLEPVIVMDISDLVVVDPLSIYRTYNYALWDSMILHKLFYFTVNSYI
ncbi:hypothetical protein Drorol1_Dr00025024 [Drosera rotundifolia]